MTSDEIKQNGGTWDNTETGAGFAQAEWLREIAYQLAVMNEGHGLGEKEPKAPGPDLGPYIGRAIIKKST